MYLTIDKGRRKHILDFGPMPYCEEVDSFKILKENAKKNHNEVMILLASLSDKINNMSETLDSLKKHFLAEVEEEKIDYFFSYDGSHLSFSLLLDQWIETMEVFSDRTLPPIGEQTLDLEMYSQNVLVATLCATFSLLEGNLYQVTFTSLNDIGEITFPATLKGSKYLFLPNEAEIKENDNKKEETN